LIVSVAPVLERVGERICRSTRNSSSDGHPPQRFVVDSVDVDAHSRGAQRHVALLESLSLKQAIEPAPQLRRIIVAECPVDHCACSSGAASRHPQRTRLRHAVPRCLDAIASRQQQEHGERAGDSHHSQHCQEGEPIT
jgi:hypothetical protein